MSVALAMDRLSQLAQILQRALAWNYSNQDLQARFKSDMEPYVTDIVLKLFKGLQMVLFFIHKGPHLIQLAFFQV
jgi:hypothetical protein